MGSEDREASAVKGRGSEDREASVMKGAVRKGRLVL